MYLLDANAFITAHRSIYPFDVYPGYWDWLAEALADGTIGSIRRVRDELTSQEDELQLWVEDQVGMSLEPDDAVIDSLRRLAVWTTAQDRFLDAAKAEFLDVADYFLVGQAMAHGHVLVTLESSQPEGKKKVKIPDACDAFGVEWIKPIEMLRREGVRFVLDRRP